MGGRRIIRLLYFGSLRSQTVESGHRNKALRSVTCATLNSTALGLDFLSHEIANVSDPPAGCEAKTDTDCVPTLCNSHMTTNINDILCSAVTPEVPPGNH